MWISFLTLFDRGYIVANCILEVVGIPQKWLYCAVFSIFRAFSRSKKGFFISNFSQYKANRLSLIYLGREWFSALIIIILVLAGIFFAISKLAASFKTDSAATTDYVAPQEIIYVAPGDFASKGAFLIDSKPSLAFSDDSLGRGGLQNGSSDDLILVGGTALLAYTPPGPIEDFADFRNSAITYEVQSGDTLSQIAEKFEIGVNTLLWANNLPSIHSIVIGQKLKILPIDGVFHTIKKGDTVSSIASKYKGDMEEIIAFNDLPADGFLVKGETIIVPDGKMPLPTNYTSSQQRYIASLPYYAGYYLMPTTGFNWKRLHPHNAVDIANACGTPILAAASGTVAISDGVGWNGGYGKYIRISHSNGTATLYAHNSQNLVSAGEWVEQGQTIALIGTTGRSTGCHVHFEVRGARNPFL